MRTAMPRWSSRVPRSLVVMDAFVTKPTTPTFSWCRCAQAIDIELVRGVLKQLCAHAVAMAGLS